MIQLQNISAGYGELPVLTSINLTLNKGEILALIGPNGAGKSTVIKAIAGIADVTHGTIHFNEKNITEILTHELLSLGISYVNQGRILFENLTIHENITIIHDALTTEQRKNFAEKINEMYTLFPALKDRKHHLANGLSGGERQMLALSRALVSQPRLLLLDEPTLGLSPKLQTEFFTLLTILRKKGLAILIVEQNAKKAIEMADRTILLEQGKIVLEGGTEMLKQRKIKKVYLGGGI